MSPLPIADMSELLPADRRRAAPHRRFSTMRGPIVFALFLLLLVGCSSDEPSNRGSATGTKKDTLAANLSDSDDDDDQIAPVTEVSDSTGMIRLDLPAPGATINGRTLRIAGKAVLPDTLGRLHYRLVYDSTVSIARGDMARVGSDSTAPTDFSGTIEIERIGNGTVFLEVFGIQPKSNREVLTVSIPLVLPDEPEPDSSATIYAYFSNPRKGSQRDCRLVLPLSRTVAPEIESRARAAIYHLLRGPSDEEKSNGFFSRLPRRLTLDHLSLSDGVARLDFSLQLTQSFRACRARSIRSQIEQTMIQFDSVDAVVITAGGRLWTAGDRE